MLSCSEMRAFCLLDYLFSKCHITTEYIICILTLSSLSLKEETTYLLCKTKFSKIHTLVGANVEKTPYFGSEYQSNKNSVKIQKNLRPLKNVFERVLSCVTAVFCVKIISIWFCLLSSFLWHNTMYIYFFLLWKLV